MNESHAHQATKTSVNIMSIRCFFILSVHKQSLLYIKSFPVIEAKAKRLGLEPLPPLSQDQDEKELVQAVLKSLGIETKSPLSDATSQSVGLNPIVTNQQQDLSSSCLPGLEIYFKSTSLWPILITEQSGMLYCALPLMYSDDRELAHHLPVSAAFSFLQHVMSFTESESRLTMIESYLSVISPLGRFIGGSVNPMSLEKKGSGSEDVINVTVTEKVSRYSNSGLETIFGTLSIESGLCDSRSASRTNCLIISVPDLSILDLVLPPPVSILPPSKLQINLSKFSDKINIQYQKKSETMNATADLIQHKFIYRKTNAGSNAYNITLTLTIKKLAENMKFKVTHFAFIWKINAADSYRFSNVETSQGKVSLEPIGLVWNLGQKLSRQAITLTADLTAPNGLSDVNAVANFRFENIAECFNLRRDAITINDSNRSSKLMLQKSISTADYRIHIPVTGQE